MNHKAIHFQTPKNSTEENSIKKPVFFGRKDLKNPDYRKQAYANFLQSQNFTHFATFTTGREMTLNSARRNMTRFYELISNSNQNFLNTAIKNTEAGTIYPVSLFWVAEPFDAKEGFHTHALIDLPKNFIKYGQIFKLWNKITGERRSTGKNSRIDIQKYYPNLGANHYVGKYLLKKNCDYDFYFKK